MIDNSDRFVIAVAAVIRKKEQILIMKRSEKKLAGPGLWEVLSGRVEHGEDLLEAIYREIQEESGLQVKVNPRPVNHYMATRLGVPMLLIVYSSEYLSGEVSLSEEHSEFRWATIEEFRERCSLSQLVQSAELAFSLDRDVIS